MLSGIQTIPQFVYELMLKNDKSNFASFKIRIEQSATRTGLKGYIAGDISCPSIIILSSGQVEPTTSFYLKTPSRNEWDFRDGCATALIVQNIINPVAIGLSVEGTSAEIWVRLERLCIPKSNAALLNAENTINNATFTGGSIDELEAHWADLNVQVTTLKLLGKAVANKDLKGVLIQSLPATNPQWLPIIAQLFPHPTAEDVWAAIMLYAATIKLPRSPTGGSTVFATTGKRHCTNPNCKAKDRNSHWIIDCYWEGGGKEGQFPPHFGRRKKQNQSQANQTTTNAPATTPSTSHTVLAVWSDDTDWDSSIAVAFEDEEGMIHAQPAPTPLSSCDYCPIVFTVDAPPPDAATISRIFKGTTPTVSLTFLNSGASDHFFRDRRDFTEYKSVPYCTGRSALASEGDFSIVGKGTINHTFEVGGRKVTITFKNALHAPSLSANLISVSQFDCSGYFSLFGRGEVIMTVGRGGKPVLHGWGSAGMYVLDHIDNFAMLSTSAPVDFETWHRRFAHSDVEHIREMVSKGLVDDSKITNLKVEGRCPDCQAGCQHARPFDNPTEPDLLPLALVATDLWGLSRTASPGGNIYMMVMVDAGTSFKYSEFLKDKSNNSTIKAFNNYCVLMENQTGRKVKRVQTDNVFNSRAWTDYFKTHGIIHETTALYSSAQNGLAERALCTILEDVRTGLHDSQLPHNMWAAAAASSIYVHNCMPIQRHPGQIPAEEMLGSRQSVAHLRVWGSCCVAKAPVVHGVRVDGKSKLDDRGIPATLIGYGVGAGNYVLMDNHSVQFVSCNVEFDETRRRGREDGGIFGEGVSDVLQTPVHSDAFNSAPSNVVVAPGHGAKLDSSQPSITSPSVPASVHQAPANNPIIPQPRCSTHVPIHTRAAMDNTAYGEREDLARAAGEDWATETPAAHVAYQTISAELNDFVALMSATAKDDTYEPKPTLKQCALTRPVGLLPWM